MSNNKQTMKLYTEEQVKNAIQMAAKHRYLFESEENEIINLLSPIELPSEEEIYIEAKSKRDNIKKLPFDSASFIFGAMWLKDKIQGGNNEQN
jgi:hypothetical protein